MGEDEPILITISEKLESNENGAINPKYEPVDRIFIYDYETGEKVNWSRQEETI